MPILAVASYTSLTCQHQVNPTDLLFWDNFDTTVTALYGQMESDLANNGELAIAARYDREERTVDNQVPNVTNSGLNVNLLDPEFTRSPSTQRFKAVKFCLRR